MVWWTHPVDEEPLLECLGSSKYPGRMNRPFDSTQAMLIADRYDGEIAADTLLEDLARVSLMY